MTAKKSTDPRRCSLAEAERCLGVSRQTLAKWIDRGAPVVEQSAGKGKPTLVSVPDLHKWSVERATEEAEARLKEQIDNMGIEADVDPARMPKDEADRRKAVAEALRSELRLAGDAGNLVPVADVGPAVARHLAPVRERLMGLHKELPEKLERRTGVSARISTNMIRSEIDACLADIAKEVTLLDPDNDEIPDVDAPDISD
jgi:phage terminase Nu1 subunit (DNA packaging protein)